MRQNQIREFRRRAWLIAPVDPDTANASLSAPIRWKKLGLTLVFKGEMPVAEASVAAGKT